MAEIKQERGMSPRYYRNRLIRFWWLLLLCGVCSGFGGWLGGALFLTVYSSTAVVQVDMRMSSPTTATTVFVDRLTHTCAQVAVSSGLLAPIASHEGMTVTKLHSEVTATPLANTQLCSITARDASSSRAARLANAIANAVVTTQTQALSQANTQSQQPYVDELKTLSASITTLHTQLAKLGQPPSDPAKAESLQAQLVAAQAQYDLMQSTLSRIQIVEASGTPTIRVASLAQPSGTPIISHQIATGLAGVIFGLTLGVFLVSSGEWLNTRVQSPEGVAASFQWVQLGTARALRGETRAKAYGSEAYALATMLARDIDFLGVDRPLRALALVSANPSPRTSGLAAQLASVIAQRGRNTLLVDARLRDGAQSDGFGVPAEPGLSDLILQSKSARPTAQSVMAYLRAPTRNSDSHLRVLPAGSRPPNPERTLSSNSCKAALTAILALPAEIVLIDTSAAILGGNSESLQAALDGAVILIDPVTARWGDVAALGRAIARSSVPILGFVYMEGELMDMKSDATELRACGAQEASLAKP